MQGTHDTPNLVASDTRETRVVFSAATPAPWAWRWQQTSVALSLPGSPAAPEGSPPRPSLSRGHMTRTNKSPLKGA